MAFQTDDPGSDSIHRRSTYSARQPFVGRYPSPESDVTCGFVNEGSKKMERNVVSESH